MTIDCHKLDQYLDGELAPGEHSHFTAHLADCPTCREAVDEQRWIDDLLRAPAIAPQELPTPAFVDSCRTLLARRLRSRRLKLASGIAAAAGLLIASGWMLMPNPPAVRSRDANIAAANRIGVAPPSPTVFICDEDHIAMPVKSTSPQVTIVRLFPTYQSLAAVGDSGDDDPFTQDSAWPDLSNGG